jgi:hypothetical protein
MESAMPMDPSAVPRLSEVVVLDQLLASGNEHILLSAVSKFVEYFQHRWFKNADFNPQTIQAHNLCRFITAVEKYGLSEYVYLYRWNKSINDDVGAALQAIGCKSTLKLFENLLAVIQNNPEGLKSLLWADKPNLTDPIDTAEEAAERDRLSAPLKLQLKELEQYFIFEHTNRNQYEKADLRWILLRLRTKAGLWIKTWPSLLGIPEDLIHQYCDKIAADKLTKAEIAIRHQETLDARSWECKRIDQLALAIGGKNAHWTTITTRVYDGRNHRVLNVVTSSGHYEVIFYRGEALLIPGGRPEQVAQGDKYSVLAATPEDVLARVPAPEAIGISGRLFNGKFIVYGLSNYQNRR